MGNKLELQPPESSERRERRDPLDDMVDPNTAARWRGVYSERGSEYKSWNKVPGDVAEHQKEQEAKKIPSPIEVINDLPGMSEQQKEDLLSKCQNFFNTMYKTKLDEIKTISEDEIRKAIDVCFVIDNNRLPSPDEHQSLVDDLFIGYWNQIKLDNKRKTS